MNGLVCMLNDFGLQVINLDFVYVCLCETDRQTDTQIIQMSHDFH